jgi:hypothetical protein
MENIVFCCQECVFICPLPSNGCPSIVESVCFGMCLLSRCLAMGLCVTIHFMHIHTYIRTYMLHICIQITPKILDYSVHTTDSSWQPNSLSADQEMHRRVWSPKVYYRVHNSPPVDLNLSHFNPDFYITPCSPLKVNRRSRGTCRLHLQVGGINQARNQHQRFVPEDGTLHNHRCEGLKSWTV